MPSPPMTLAALNALPPAEFGRVAGPVFEASLWIAEAVAGKRPFGSVESLWKEMCAVVRGSPVEQQLVLIRAHPDLVGRAMLTTESRGEQATAGLTGLAPEEIARFEKYNAEYRTRFGFPFVICARLNKKDAILAAFPARLGHTTEQERAAALEEIYKIARLRLDDLVAA